MMKLHSLYIENFGVLHAYSMECSDGLNRLCRENGFGKTTLAVFLKAMLYGLPNTRKADPDENDRKKYAPWQGGAFGGHIVFSARGKTYRAERFFAYGGTGGTKNDTFVLYDLADNTISDDFPEDLGGALFGIDAAAFERSAYLPQKLLPAGIENESITAKLNRVIESPEETGSYKSAAAILDGRRQYYKKHGGRGRIAELEAALASLRREEREARDAQDMAQRYTGEAVRISAEIDGVMREKAQLQDAVLQLGTQRARAAVMAHGSDLLARRNALREAVRNNRALLHLQNGDAGRAALQEQLSAAEGQVREAAGLEEQQSANAAALAACTEAQEQIAAQFCGGIPDEEVISELMRLQEIVGTTTASREAAEAVPPEGLAACLSEEELQRHMEQAVMLERIREELAAPKAARDAMRDAFEAAQIPVDTPLPDDETLNAYEDVLREIRYLRERQTGLHAQLDTDTAALDALEAAHPSAVIPEQSTLVAMRSRFDALRGRREEIEELEARQRAAVKIDEAIRSSRRRRIAIGAVLLLAAAVFGGLYFVRQEIRLLPVCAAMAIPGIVLLLLGIFTKPEENEETRALEDAAQKRLCVRKSEYEAEKTAVYEFLDRFDAEAEPVLDEEGAEVRFDRAAALAREREVLVQRAAQTRAALEIVETTLEQRCVSLTSYHAPDGGTVGYTGDDLAAFAAYRTQVLLCRDARRAAAGERERRNLRHAQEDALSRTLRAYLQQLETTCPDAAAQIAAENTDMLAQITAWSRYAQLLRIRIGDRAEAEEQRRAAAAQLDLRCRALLTDAAAEAITEEPISDRVFAMIGRYRELAAEKAAAAEARTHLRERMTLLDESLTAFLARYYEEPLPEYGEGLRRLQAAMDADMADCARLRDAEDALAAFLAENTLTEAQLCASASAAEADDTEAQSRHLTQRGLMLDESLTRLGEQRAAAVRSAEEASEAGARAAELREQIAHTASLLADAEKSLSVIMKTMSFLEDAKHTMEREYLEILQRRFRVYYASLSGIPEEEASSVTLDRSLTAQTEAFGVRHGMEYCSRGSQDLIGLCIRLALVDALYADTDGTGTGEELPPLILDDPFVNLDAKHLAAARALLNRAAERFQILYFVCHESRL